MIIAPVALLRHTRVHILFIILSDCCSCKYRGMSPYENLSILLSLQLTYVFWALARPSTTFQKIDIEIPDITTQRRIAAVLQRIHDKIAVNTAINENLRLQAA